MCWREKPSERCEARDVLQFIEEHPTLIKPSLFEVSRRASTPAVSLLLYVCIHLDEEREKERERGSNLRRQRLACPTAQVLVAQTTQPVQKRLTPGQSGWQGAAAVGSIPALALSLFLRLNFLLFLQRLGIPCLAREKLNREYCKRRNFRRRKISYFFVQNLSYGI